MSCVEVKSLDDCFDAVIPVRNIACVCRRYSGDDYGGSACECYVVLKRGMVNGRSYIRCGGDEYHKVKNSLEAYVYEGEM